MKVLKYFGWLSGLAICVLLAHGQMESPRAITLDLQKPQQINRPTEIPDDVRRDATVKAIEQALPSVVNVATEDVRPVRDPMTEFLESFWNPFYQRRAPNAPYSLGSGVIISEDGYLLSNDHVIKRANKIWVKLATSGEVYEAKIVASNPKKDLALLKIVAPAGNKFTAIKFAAEDDLLLGETVLALGNPFNLGGSVSRGILSSKSRVEARGDEALNLYNCLQTDASINPGNSGGPLVNLRGELIGVSAVILKDAQGIGFAIPVTQINEALSAEFTPETIKRLWFGARVKVDNDGLAISAVDAESPAASAGLKIGDAVKEVNGRAVDGIISFNQSLIDAAAMGVSLKIVRAGTPKTVTVQLVPEESFFNGDLIKRRLGVELQEITPELGQSLGLDSSDGFVVAGLEENSPAAASLGRGAVIVTIEGQSPPDLTGFAKILHPKAAGETVRLGVVVKQRQGNYVFYRQGAVDVRVR